MENDTLDGLQYIGYSGPILEDGGFDKAVSETFNSPIFRHVVVWLCTELKVLCKLDEQVNEINSTEEAKSFLLELSCFLKELGCQYKCLTEGQLNEKLQDKMNCILLLHYLVTELQAARMVSLKKPLTNTLEIKLQESSTANEIKCLLIALQFPKPPNNISPAALYNKVHEKLKEVVSRAPPELLSKPLFTRKLSDKEWHILADIQKDLHSEYRMRREMLIKRLDVTVQSFQWSDKVKNKVDEVANAMSVKRRAMDVQPNVRLSDVLAARQDLAILEKTSSASVRRNTKSQLNTVIIGQVPDRGGRTTDQAPPPPEMPSWQKDRAPGPPGGSRGGGFGGGNRGRGGHYGGGERNRVQGGWNRGSQDRGYDNQQQDRRGRGNQDYGDNYQQDRGRDYKDQGQYRGGQGGGYHRDRGQDNYHQGSGGGHHRGSGRGHHGGQRRDYRQ